MFRVQSSMVRYKTFHSSFAGQNLSSVLQPKHWGMDRAPSMFLWTITVHRGLCFIYGSMCQALSVAPPAPASLLLSLIMHLVLELQFPEEHAEWMGWGGSEERKPEPSASPPEAGGGLWIPSAFSHHLSFCPTLCWDDTTGRCTWVCLTPTYWKFLPAQASGCLSVLVYEVRHLNLSCLYTVHFSGGLGEASSRPSRQRPFLNQRLCSLNCQLCLAPAFIQPKNLDVNILQE